MTLYKPHESVATHPESTPFMIVFMGKRSPEDMARIIQIWKRMDDDTHEGKTFTMAIDWDLRTHYGMSDADLGPPIIEE